MKLAYVYLAIAIVSEVIATSSLKASHSFTKLVPSLLVVVGYATAFYCLSLSLEKISIGVAYALWSGVGILLLAGVGVVVYGEKIDAAAAIGFLLIFAGIAVLNLFSKTVSHG
jgi:small multidrug resistance pump